MALHSALTGLETFHLQGENHSCFLRKELHRQCDIMNGLVQADWAPLAILENDTRIKWKLEHTSYTSKQEETLKHMKNKHVFWGFKTTDNMEKYFKEVNVSKYYLIFGLGCLDFLLSELI